MSSDDHVRAEHYVLARHGRTGRGALALQVHQHLVHVCRDCSDAWRLVGERQDAFREILLGVGRVASASKERAEVPPRNLQSTYSWEARRVEREATEIRRIQGEAGKRAWELLRLSPEERPHRVRRAWKRFRSYAEAEYLLGKARECIREDPREAESLAATAALIARRIPGAAGTGWGTELEARATAWRANALRVAGDLPAANRIFVGLRHSLATAPLDDAKVVGEVASLEASLRIDERSFGQARTQLDLALVIARTIGDPGLEVRVLINNGNLSAVQGKDQAALRCFEEAAAVVDALESATAAVHVGAPLHLAIINGRIFSLCELGQYTEAQQLLESHLELYERSDRIYMGAVLRYHEGRIALGLERFPQANRHLADAREVFLELDRNYDALLATLDLAWSFACSGRLRDLRSVAGRLVPQFRARHVSREALAALRLLVRAIEEQTVSADLLSRLRARLRMESLCGDSSVHTPDGG